MPEMVSNTSGNDVSRCTCHPDVPRGRYERHFDFENFGNLENHDLGRLQGALHTAALLPPCAALRPTGVGEAEREAYPALEGACARVGGCYRVSRRASRVLPAHQTRAANSQRPRSHLQKMPPKSVKIPSPGVPAQCKEGEFSPNLAPPMLKN